MEKKRKVLYGGFRRKAVEKGKQAVSCCLAAFLICGMIFSYLPVKEVKAEAEAETETVLAWSDEWHHYCIDGSGYVPNCSSTKNDKYVRVNPREVLNSDERAILFWAMLSFMASYRCEETAAGKIALINQGAEAAGLKKIERGVSEQDLKAVLHSPTVRAKYDWLDFAVAHGEEYLRLAGLVTDSGETVSGKMIPTILQDSVSLGEAVQAAGRDGEFVLQFDDSGKDGDFLEKVPLKMSADGINWAEGTINGWNVEKTENQLRITNPDIQAQSVYLKFDTAGTDYGRISSSYNSPDECYNHILQVWKCVECSGTHATGGRIHPLEKHQRTIWMDFNDTPEAYYAVLEKEGRVRKKGGGELNFQVYHHEENMEADYLVQLYKYDYETGKPLEGAAFDLYERFDDNAQIKTEKLGKGEIYEEEIRHTPVLWDGFRLVTSVRTDSEGRASYKLEKSYHYDKTFCDGHPAPVFAVFSQGQDEEQIKASNAELALEWLECAAACEEKAKDGTHFHWKMEEVDFAAIQAAAVSGEAVEAGSSQSADAETAYEVSGCKADCEETYKAFISLHYSYTFVETVAREGYVLHGRHRDDVPVEIITTDSSQNGANGEFGGGYSHEILSRGQILPEQERSQKEQAGDENSKSGGFDDGRAEIYYTEEIRTRQIGVAEKNLVKSNYRKDQVAEEIKKGTLSTAVRMKNEKSGTVSDGERRKERQWEDSSIVPAGTREETGFQMFADAYKEAFVFAGRGEEVEKGPEDLYSHGGGQDGREDAWRIYDHRTEGQIHINKRDMELQNQEKEGYSSYGDTQGDAVLEGAVYGLFAAQDLLHPDGITGVVFQANDLVAIASTDKEGNASFLAITEAPGHTYDYKTGSVTVTKNGWDFAAPKNLYMDTFEVDDYEENGEGEKYVRQYRNCEAENGNCWIGRPLLLGNYYVKELSRSEGYELSVNGRNHQDSNYGAELEITVGAFQEESGMEGSVAITRAPYVEQQSSGEEEDTMPNVINFVITSKGTGDHGYHIVMNQFPEGTKLFRKDTTETETEVKANTGKKEKKKLFDRLGQPIYQKADADNTYPKRNPDGSFMTTETAVSGVISSMGKASIQTIDETLVKEVLKNGSDENSSDWEKNENTLDLDGKKGEQFLYVKMKVEMALRANGYETPKREKKEQNGSGENSGNENDSGAGSSEETQWSEYSSRTEGVYNLGIRRGEPDYEGISGTVPGNTATDTVYGHPIMSVEIPKVRQDGSSVTVADAILSLIDFYEENPWYNFGGVDGYKETDHGWQFQIYAGITGSPADFIVLGKDEESGTIYHRIPWIPEKEEECPRWIYVAYCNDPGQNAFGIYQDFRSWQTLGTYQCSAVLVSDAVALGDGTIRSKTVKQNVYYEKGETLLDQEGKPIQAYEWADITTTVTHTQEISCWQEITPKESGKALVSHGKGRYKDFYGNEKNDEDGPLDTVYKLVLPQIMVTLTQDDIKYLPSDSGYAAGDEISAGDYALAVLGAQIQVYLDYDSQTMAGENLYVQPVSLVYPGQEYLFQDGNGKPGEGTQKNPVGVQERIIRQPVKVTKSISQQSSVMGGMGKAMDNFRFKVYLKSNLQRLYRDEEGTIVWLNRDGGETEPGELKESYPGLVPKFYTRTSMKDQSLSSAAPNTAGDSEGSDREKDNITGQNTKHTYTAVLEISAEAEEDGNQSQEQRQYNYKKFFDAISVANQDKWKNPSLSYTSNRPLGGKAKLSQEAEENASVSDRVRQFAIDWYLEQEVKKEIHAGTKLTYGDQLYDQSLREAIKKAETYLKPFFIYDLDSIYAIEWDCQDDGGKDHDRTTLSADTEEDEWCFGISAELPYGTYVIVEQQPMDNRLEDLKNRCYQIDVPKEIRIPAVYGNYEEARKIPEEMSRYYQYHKEDSSEELQKKYHIRFKGENPVIKAHNHQGDFEVYRYHSVPETEEGTAVIGATKVFDGEYSHSLVPWSMTMPEEEISDMEPHIDGESSYRGFAYRKFTNFPYRVRLRIEKLDSETHENVLHDQALFRLYKGEQDESEHGTGGAKLYEKETRIAGSREFLIGMGASNIIQESGDVAGSGIIYSGLVPAGTPICREEDQIIMEDQYGIQTGEFKAYSTTRDGLMENIDGSGVFYGRQNVGYLETPQDLEAGVYVLVEIKPPAGYHRTKPVALEVYSDRTAYYKEGNSQEKVFAAIFTQAAELAQAEKFRKETNLARIYIENAPIAISIEKRKKIYDKVTYKIDGRIDGSLAQIGGNPAYEYAYSQGQYLGYAWKKGTLEYLKKQKDAGAQVEIVYHGGVFAGYGYVTITLRTEGAENLYVPGATMTLYEGLELKSSGKKGDYGYEGLVVERSITGTISRMYVKEGYAGTRVEFVQQRFQGNGPDGEENIPNQKAAKGYKAVIQAQKLAKGQKAAEEAKEILTGTWDAAVVNRPDTDILYYDLGDLDIFKKDDITNIQYGYDFDHNLVDLQQLEEDRRNIRLTGQEYSIFAFKDNKPYLELTGGDFTKITYHPYQKSLTVPDGVRVYHIDSSGNRDAQTDPDTGMAFVKEEATGKIYVWPVTVATDESGNRISSDKRTTSRMAAIGFYPQKEENGISKETRRTTDHEEVYLTGTWKSDNGEESHKMLILPSDSDRDNCDDEIISHGNNGKFVSYVRPVLNRYGLPEYYSLSNETYGTNISLYDNNGNFLRKKSSDFLKVFQKASGILDNRNVLEGQEPDIRHRYGENYLLENTWITGEATPDDPFNTVMSEGQADLLKRIPAGSYILEEIKTPAGYVKGFPVGITIEETAMLQTAKMEDDQTKLLIRKLDETREYEYEILDMTAPALLGSHVQIGKLSEGKGSFSHMQIPGAKLALYQAEKSEDDSQAMKKGKQIAVWETEKEPFYLKQLEKGTYLLEELEPPEGFIADKLTVIELAGTAQVQVADILNDHTKVEFEKYTMNGTQKELMDGAGFTLYEAVTDEKGQIVYEEGRPEYYEGNVVDRWITSDGKVYQEFISAFEDMYQDNGTSGKTVSWSVDGQNYEAKYVSHQQIDASVSGGESSLFPTSAELLFRMTGGEEIRIVVYQEQDSRKGRDFIYEYQFDYKKLPGINDHAVSYVTIEGMRRFDYLPAGKSFVLAETRPPEGCTAAPPQVVTVEETAQVQRYRIQNQESVLLISKCVKEGTDFQKNIKELSGAHLALYRAGRNGDLIQESRYLVAEWISGSDGIYTESDQHSGQIPEGYQKGDKKPHELRRLPDGVYYLAELESPDYYTLMEPVKIVYSQNDQIRVVRVWNERAEGELEVLKTNENGDLINGAVFELTAYAAPDFRHPVLKKRLSDQGGQVRVSGLPIGRVEADGNIVPYHYQLKELIPPKGYASDLQVYSFQFQQNQKEAGLEGQQIKKTLQIVNKKTRITIGKKDFDFPAQWVLGAELAVYHVTGRDEQGRYLYNEEAPEAVWATGESQSYVVEGLAGGETYLLAERKVPKGFEQMKPYAFTLSADGRRICSVTRKTGIVTLHSYEGSDSIRSLEIQNRYGVKVEMELRDEEGALIASWTAGGDGHILRPEDGIEDKKVYSLTETTVYSDGSREITGRTTRRVHLTEQGIWKIPDRRIEKVQVNLAYEDGTEITSWIPSEKTPRIEINNPAAPERLKITIGNRRQGSIVETGGAVNAADTIWVAIECTNTSHSQEDMILTVKPENGVLVIDAGEGNLENGQIQYLLEQMEPGESRQVQYACQLEEAAEEVSASVLFQCGEEKTESRKTVPVSQPDHLTVFYEVTGTGKEQEKENLYPFQVFLYTADGEELRGSYHYRGSREGSMKSGDILQLAANEYVTINPGNIYKNIRYKVTDLQENQSLQGQVSEAGACTFFSRKTEDKTQTSIFQKGQQYQLTEITLYSDGSARDSHKMRFSLDSQGAVQGIDVLNQRQKVSLSKREITGQTELEGALLQVCRKDGTVLEEWISTKEPHLLETVLTVGQTYILHEETAPEGYGYEEDILFQVGEGEYINQVIMEDQITKVIVSKKQLTGEDEVPGAKLQILDEEGNVAEEWISGTEPHEITGKLQAGKNYILHEEGPPDGYGYATDCSFMVAADGNIDVLEMRDAPTHVEVSKTDITGDREIPGAKMKVIDREGNTVCQWISAEKPYQLVGVLKAGETYILQEEAAPEGYAYGSDVQFTVSEDGSIDHVIMKDEATRAEILKTDSETGEGLPGAQLELLTMEGVLMESWTSTKEPHVIEGKLLAGGSYVLREKAAPSGYRRCSEDIIVVIPKEAQIITITMENQRKIPISEKITTTKIKEKKEEEKKEETEEETQETEEIKELEKIGKVHTDYESGFMAHRGISYQTFTNLGLPKLGDSSQDDRILSWLAKRLNLSAERGSKGELGKYAVGGALGLLAVAVALMRKKQRSRFLILLCLCVVFGIFMSISARGETVEVKPDGHIVVTGEIYKEADQLPEVLPEIFWYGDMEYERQSYQIITAMSKAGTKEVEEEIIYEEVEQIDVLPETAKILVTDQRYQTEYEQEFPVVDVNFFNWRWIPGFELPLVVEEADADIYELNGLQVPAQEEAPFTGYEEELLKLAGTDPKYYRITEVRWEGEPWIGEDQKIYRNAVAAGEKYVADCQVVYGGNAVLEPVHGVAWQAIYQRIQELEEETLKEEETGMVQESESAPDDEKSPAGSRAVWYQASLGQTVISVGILAAGLFFLIIFLIRREKRQKLEDRNL